MRLTTNFLKIQEKVYAWFSFSLPHSQILMEKFRQHYNLYLITQEDQHLDTAQAYLKNAYQAAIKETE